MARKRGESNERREVGISRAHLASVPHRNRTQRSQLWSARPGELTRMDPTTIYAPNAQANLKSIQYTKSSNSLSLPFPRCSCLSLHPTDVLAVHSDSLDSRSSSRDPRLDELRRIRFPSHFQHTRRTALRSRQCPRETREVLYRWGEGADTQRNSRWIVSVYPLLDLCVLLPSSSPRTRLTLR